MQLYLDLSQPANAITMLTMDVYSARKPVGSSATLIATSVLLAIALMQSFAMVQQKRQRWDELFGEHIALDAESQIRVPKSWSQTPLRDDPLIIFMSGSEDAALGNLWIHRSSGASSIREARDIMVPLITNDGDLVLTFSTPIRTQFGSEPAELTLLSMNNRRALQAIDGSHFVIVLFFCKHANGKTTIMAMTPNIGLQSRAVTLLKQIGRNATTID